MSQSAVFVVPHKVLMYSVVCHQIGLGLLTDVRNALNKVIICSWHHGMHNRSKTGAAARPAGGGQIPK